MAVRLLGEQPLESAATALRGAVTPPVLVKFAIAGALPVMAGIMAEELTTHLGVVHVSFIFMTSVICAGALYGVAPALFSAALAFAIYNFFLVEPRFSLQLATADDFVTLLLFFAAAALTGGLAGRLRDQVALSQRQLRTTQALFEASQRLSKEATPAAIYRALAESAEHALASPAVVLTPSPTGWTVATVSPQPSTGAPNDIEQRALAALKQKGDAAAGWIVAHMRTQAGEQLGAIALRPEPSADNAERERILDSIASLGAVAIERSLLAAEMSQARALAETERLRSALLSSMSHDFRTPLATIMASSTSLLDYENELDAVARRELLEAIRDETEGMSVFVANLLEMTRLEAGALRPRLIAADVEAIAGDAVALFSRRAAARGAALQCNTSSMVALADPALLERALLNLLDNAIQFSGEGDVVELNAGLSDAGNVVLEVIDQGPGVDAVAQSRIFEKFWRAPEHANRRRGVGLGLSIAKALVDSMGGAIRVESPVRDGKGSRFVITLPAASAGQHS